MDYLKIKNISVWYGQFRALKDISLYIQKGELFTLLGPSGSGKSTILLTIAGFVNSQNGSISIENQSISELPPNKREIGMVFQSYALFPHKSVFQNIAYPLQIRHLPKTIIKKRVEELLKMVDLQDTESRMPHELSGGQQQRVALARALSFNPRVLLLDEPLSNLDKKLREQMQVEIRRIQRSLASTVLYVTHDQNEAMTISDRIAIINNGKIEQIGTPRDIYEKPTNPFVANFLGEANFLKVRVISLEQCNCTVELYGKQLEHIPRPQWLNKTGIDVMLLIRPEHLQIYNGDPNSSNEIDCKIEDVYYLGHTLRIRCILKGGEKIYVQKSVSDNVTLPNSNSSNYSLKINTEKACLFKEI